MAVGNATCYAMDMNGDRRMFVIRRDDRLVGGVMAGLARYADVNPNILRAGYLVVTVFFPVPGIAAYGILFYFLPKERGLFE